ncbi:MAG: hypothetical protein ABUT39_01490 [Acidobacteriota bacterium]
MRLIDAETRQPLLRVDEQSRLLDETQRALQAAEEEIARLRRQAGE